MPALNKKLRANEADDVKLAPKKPRVSAPQNTTNPKRNLKVKRADLAASEIVAKAPDAKPLQPKESVAPVSEKKVTPPVQDAENEPDINLAASTEANLAETALEAVEMDEASANFDPAESTDLAALRQAEEKLGKIVASKGGPKSVLPRVEVNIRRGIEAVAQAVQPKAAGTQPGQPGPDEPDPVQTPPDMPPEPADKPLPPVKAAPVSVVAQSSPHRPGEGMPEPEPE